MHVHYSRTTSNQAPQSLQVTCQSMPYQLMITVQQSSMQNWEQWFWDAFILYVLIRSEAAILLNAIIEGWTCDNSSLLWHSILAFKMDWNLSEYFVWVHICVWNEVKHFSGWADNIPAIRTFLPVSIFATACYKQLSNLQAIVLWVYRSGQVHETRTSCECV